MIRLRPFYLLWMIFRALILCLGGLVIGSGLAPLFPINDHDAKVLVGALCAAPSAIFAMMVTGRDLLRLFNEELQSQDDEWNRLVNAGIENSHGKSESN